MDTYYPFAQKFGDLMVEEFSRGLITIKSLERVLDNLLSESREDDLVASKAEEKAARCVVEAEEAKVAAAIAKEEVRKAAFVKYATPDFLNLKAEILTLLSGEEPDEFFILSRENRIEDAEAAAEEAANAAAEAEEAAAKATAAAEDATKAAKLAAAKAAISCQKGSLALSAYNAICRRK